MSESTAAARRVADAFEVPGRCAGVHAHGAGHIHGSFRADFVGAGGAKAILLQRVNTEVFRDPDALAANIGRVTDWLRADLAHRGVAHPERRCLSGVPTRAGRVYEIDDRGVHWRAFHFIPRAHSQETAASPTEGQEVARAFGAFARVLSDLPGPPLAETIPHFHDLELRMAAFSAALEADAPGRAGAVSTEIDRVERWYATLDGDTDQPDPALLPRRVLHHDCKINNALLDDETGQALCVVDLDTTMPGIITSDFGELVRTTACPAPEDEVNLGSMELDLELFRAVCEGYLAGIGDRLSDEERRALPGAGPRLTLMNAVRFLTDYLEGDVYFQVARERHNLERCRAQLRRLELLHEQRDPIARILEEAAH